MSLYKLFLTNVLLGQCLTIFRTKIIVPFPPVSLNNFSTSIETLYFDESGNRNLYALSLSFFQLSSSCLFENTKITLYRLKHNIRTNIRK